MIMLSPFFRQIVFTKKKIIYLFLISATPFRENQIDDPRKTQFNTAFCRARVSVECTIGKIKARFPILKDGFRFKSMQKVGRCIEALCAIHNFIVIVSMAQNSNRVISMKTKNCERSN